MKVTPHFTLYELLRSETAERDPVLYDAQMSPPFEVRQNLIYLAETTLEPLREMAGVPIRVTSGYRSPKVNKKVGGSKTSQHVKGQAADLQVADRYIPDLVDKLGRKWRQEWAATNANFLLFAFIVLAFETLDIDQLIHEYGARYGMPAWVHVSASREKDRRQILKIGSYTGRKYVPMTISQALHVG